MNGIHLQLVLRLNLKVFFYALVISFSSRIINFRAKKTIDELWLHVRSLGNWTNKLYDHFYDFSKYNRNNSIYSTHNMNKDFASNTKYERKMSNLGNNGLIIIYLQDKNLITLLPSCDG